VKNSFQITSDFHQDCRRFPFRLLQNSVRIARGFYADYFRVPSGLPQVSIQITSEFYPDAATGFQPDYFIVPYVLPQVFLQIESPFFLRFLRLSTYYLLAYNPYKKSSGSTSLTPGYLIFPSRNLLVWGAGGGF
jgi:hypothetical protein